MIDMGISYVSIADATLASPQLSSATPTGGSTVSFNRRRDACFPATRRRASFELPTQGFNRRRDACFPATWENDTGGALYIRFQSQTRRLLPRNDERIFHRFFHLCL